MQKYAIPNREENQMDYITVKDVSLKLKKTVILQDINISFEAGQIHGLIGRNGSGKTMLMKCICGFVRPGIRE